MAIAALTEAINVRIITGTLVRRTERITGAGSTRAITATEIGGARVVIQTGLYGHRARTPTDLAAHRQITETSPTDRTIARFNRRTGNQTGPFNDLITVGKTGFRNSAVSIILPAATEVEAEALEVTEAFPSNRAGRHNRREISRHAVAVVAEDRVSQGLPAVEIITMAAVVHQVVVALVVSEDSN
jgi:hypothetical protein